MSTELASEPSRRQSCRCSPAVSPPEGAKAPRPPSTPLVLGDIGLRLAAESPRVATSTRPAIRLLQQHRCHAARAAERRSRWQADVASVRGAATRAARAIRFNCPVPPLEGRYLPDRSRPAPVIASSSSRRSERVVSEASHIASDTAQRRCRLESVYPCGRSARERWLVICRWLKSGLGEGQRRWWGADVRAAHI